MRFLALIFCCAMATAQQTSPAQSPTAAPVQPSLTNVTFLPKLVVTGGGGFASPNGKFGYVSESTYVGAGTYATVAIEDTIVKGNVESCTLAGVTKPLYQLSVFTAGLTGLGGGCTSTAGTSTATGAGQAFLDVQWGKLPLGNTITVMKLTTGSFKVTIGFRWAK